MSHVEANTHSPIIHTAQKWIEQEIAGKGICPPLKILMGRHPHPSGVGYDWIALRKEIDMHDLTNRKPSERDSLAKLVISNYLRFVSEAAAGRAPLTMLQILPLFDSNQAYDEFMALIERTAVIRLSSSKSKSLIRSLAVQMGNSTHVINAGLNTPDGQLIMATRIITASFRFIYFYGRDLSDNDVADFSSSRGDVNRYKVLSRAPFYATQVVNPFRGRELSASMNVDSIHRRNSALAKQTNADEHGAIMDSL